MLFNSIYQQKFNIIFYLLSENFLRSGHQYTKYMQASEFLDDLFTFIRTSPTAFHATQSALQLLGKEGFTLLDEQAPWGHLAPGAYMVERDQASLVAFFLNSDPQTARPWRMVGAHTDSPALKVKPQGLRLRQNCVQLCVEIYGGPLLASWFDRELSLAGRVIWLENNHLQTALVDYQRPLAIIPSLALHLDREANTARSIDKQVSLIPLIALKDPGKTGLCALSDLLEEEMAHTGNLPPDAEILDFDLFLYDPQAPCRLGLHGELISSPRLDNLVSCHAALRALLDCPKSENILIVLNNHEETGSLSSTGAQGSFLKDVLARLYPLAESQGQAMAGSLLVSADNAHAVHPNFPERHDPEHLPLLNGGLVIKYNANQRYATDGAGAGLFRWFCRQADVPCQSFVMRNDLPCGSTIGPTSAAALGVRTVDVGVPQLAMHSIRECAGSLDCWHLYRALRKFFAAKDAQLLPGQAQ